MHCRKATHPGSLGVEHRSMHYYAASQPAIGIELSRQSVVGAELTTVTTAPDDGMYETPNC